MTKQELKEFIEECILEVINEGRMKDIALDLKELNNAEFEKKYGKTKKEILKLLKSRH